ncbi:MAG: hypothetical protein R6W77_00365, partial [Trueperaceae bacterium]
MTEGDGVSATAPAVRTDPRDRSTRGRRTRRPLGALLLMLALTLGLTACTQLFGTSLAGRWAGTFTDSEGGGGILLLELQLDCHVPLTTLASTCSSSSRMPPPPSESVNVPAQRPASDVPNSCVQAVNPSVRASI